MLCFRCGSYNAENAQKCTVCGQGFIDESGRVVGPPRREVKAATQPASVFVPGELVAGRYRIREMIGQGGVGAVYRARDLEIDVDIAIKGITPNLLQTEEEQKNFSRQIKGARKLQHPNIVRIYDEGAEGNRRFFSMKLLEGLTLRKIIRLRHEKGQPFSAEELVPIFHQLAAALDYAHKSTWHGDLKPENIIILPDLLKITDFNLLKALPLKPFLGIAKSRSKGFPYIAPELRVESQTIDGRCDIYAMGVILAEMLTGLVFEGHYTRAMTAALEQLPTKLDGLVRKALTEHPDGRYQRGSDLARDLEAALAAMTTPLPAPARLQPAPTPGFAAPAAGTVKPPAEPAVQPPPVKPPPPPEETGPSLVAAPPPQVSSDSGASRVAAPFLGEPGVSNDDLPREPSEVLEIGQSQVLLLQSGVTKAPDELLEAARRLMAAGSNPEDTLDDGHGDVSEDPTDPRGAPLPQGARREVRREQVQPRRVDLVGAGDLPRDPARLVEGLDPRADDGFLPPPLPGHSGEGLERSLDEPVELPGDASGEGDIPTGEGQLPREAARSSRKTPPEGSDGEIHDALTALRHQPRSADGPRQTDSPGDERARADAPEETKTSGSDGPQPAHAAPEKAAENASSAVEVDAHREPSSSRARPADLVASETPRKAAAEPPPLEDEDSLRQTISGEHLKGSLETSSPSLRAAAPLPPPVVATPVLRPVAPPRRAGQSSAPLAAGAILGVVLLAVAVVVWRFFLAPAPLRPMADNAVVTAGQAPEVEAALPAVEGDAGTTDGSTAQKLPSPPDGSSRPGSSSDATPPATPPERRQASVDASTAVASRNNERDVRPAKSAGVPPETAANTPAEKVVEKPTTEKAAAERPAEAVAEKPAPETTKSPAEEPAREETKLALASGTCPRGMAFVEGGAFSFGSAASDPMRNFGEADAASVDVKSFCIEYYEQPNGKDTLPTTGVSWQTAKSACERNGRRLCTEREWERACKGPGSSRFPYGNSYDVSVCNTEDAAGKPRSLAPAVDFKRCRSGYKIFMMAGNAEEWVLDSVGGQKVAKGGAADRPDFASRCAARRTYSSRASSSTLGFRCCADPQP